MKPVVAEDRDKEEDQKQLEATQFYRIMNAMRDLIPIEKWDKLQYWAHLEDSPPTFTWKEFKKLFKKWKEDRTSVHLEKLIEDHADRRQGTVAIVAKDLFETVIAYREQLLGQAADSGVESELLEAIGEADICLSLMRILILDLRGFSTVPPFLLTEDFMKMFRHFSKWAHFVNVQYQDTRAQEASVLRVAAQSASKKAVEILEAIEPWNPLRGPSVKEQQALKNCLDQELIPQVVNELRDRFMRNDGINLLWGHERHLVEKWILFRLDGGFYSEDGLEFLKSIVERANADKDTVVHSNLLQFVLMLGYGLKRGLKVLGPSELHPLACDKVIIPLLWRGVVSKKLQPRMIGSLKETRSQLAELLGSEELLAVPDWWDNAASRTSS